MAKPINQNTATENAKIETPAPVLSPAEVKAALLAQLAEIEAAEKAAAEKAAAEKAAAFVASVKTFVDGSGKTPVEVIREIANQYQVGAVVRMPSTAGSNAGTGSAGRPRDESKWNAVRDEITANPLKSNNGVSLATGVCAATVARIRSSMHSAPVTPTA